MLTVPRQRLLLLLRYRLSQSHRRFASNAGNSSEVIGKDVSAKSSSSGWNPNGKIVVPLVLASATVGFFAGRQSVSSSSSSPRTGKNHVQVLPNGIPRTCCGQAENLTEKQKALFKTLKRIVGRKNVLDGSVETTETSQYLKGARLGKGVALYIVKPQKLKQVVEIVQEVIDADCVVLVQGQNTGLTGGSVPRNRKNSRPTVIISMKDLDTIFPIDNGERVVCLGGAGLASLHNFVSNEFPHRESHSILGSTFLNPTTAAGVAYGSGGTQCRKGPAFTERALYLKIVPDKLGCPTVKLVNTLGIEGFDSEEGEFNAHLRHDSVTALLDNYVGIVNAQYDPRMKKSNKTYGVAAASDVEYKNRICRKDEGQVNRYNADTSGCECNRSEGKVLILASVHDTFSRPMRTKTYWVSFDKLETALSFRSQVCLNNPNDIPVSVEYMDRDSFDVIDRSGRILGNLIKAVGPASPIVRTMWNIKLWIEALDFSGAPMWVDKLLYTVNPIVPAVLPRPIMDLGRQKDHHIAMTVGDFDGSLDRFLNRMKKFQQDNGEGKVSFHECTSKSQEASLTAFRFIAAPAFRTWCVGEGMQGISVDYALPGNGGQAPTLSTQPIKRMRYSHFACNVVHEDLAYAPDVDVHDAKLQLKRSVEYECNGKLPAEHGHGTEYHAPEDTQQRWKKMDPFNVMNPGVGGLSINFRYKD